MLSQELEQNLKETEEHLLRQLRQEIVIDYPEFQVDLETFLSYGSDSRLSVREKSIYNECESLKTYLMKGLTKVKMSYEEFEARANKIVEEVEE
jgi:hypothetical protein